MKIHKTVIPGCSKCFTECFPSQESSKSIALSGWNETRPPHWETPFGKTIWQYRLQKMLQRWIFRNPSLQHWEKSWINLESKYQRASATTIDACRLPSRAQNRYKWTVNGRRWARIQLFARQRHLIELHVQIHLTRSESLIRDQISLSEISDIPHRKMYNTISRTC